MKGEAHRIVMVHRPTWRNWAVPLVVIGIYIAGVAWENQLGAYYEWIYRVGLILATFIPLIFVGIWTWRGVRGDGAAWWTNTLGIALVTAAVSHVPITGPLAWVSWFDNGNITGGWLAWCEVCGPVVFALAWLWLCFIWLTTSLPVDGSA